jgi:DNA-binding NtrC family response regulator
MNTILLIDDQWGRANDPMIRERYGKLALSSDFQWALESAEEPSGIYSVEKAIARIRQDQPAVVLLDVMFGRKQPRLGVEILERIRVEFPVLPVVMFTSVKSDEDRELVVRCLELGANEYLEKPASAAQMETVLNAYTSKESDKAIYGNSGAIRGLRSKIARTAFSGQTNVLIYGESGTGKELVARAIYRQGPRKAGPFVPLNCAFLESQILESELFGHERGAFTGATTEHNGLLRSANGGVLFLDEIANMPHSLQGKLLRAIQERCFRRVGGNTEIKSNFQLVCATNRPPEQLVKDGKLREDFFYRVAAVTLQVPPLRERREDVPFLVEMFLRKCKEHDGLATYPGERFSDDSLRRMQLYDWPGNVREVENVVERSLIFSKDALIEVENLSAATRTPGSPNSVEEAVALSASPVAWERERLLSEIKFAVQAKKHVQSYKGGQWKAEFMRLMYPECKAANAKGFDDLIKRLTQGPWGSPKIRNNIEIKRLLDELSAR